MFPIAKVGNPCRRGLGECKMDKAKCKMQMGTLSSCHFAFSILHSGGSPGESHRLPPQGRHFVRRLTPVVARQAPHGRRSAAFCAALADQSDFKGLWGPMLIAERPSLFPGGIPVFDRALLWLPRDGDSSVVSGV